MTYVRPPPATHKSGLVSRAPARKRGEMTHCAAGADRGGSERRRTAGPRRSSTRCSLARSIQSQTICLRRSRHCRTVGFARPSVPPTGSLAWKFFARGRSARGSRRTCLRGAPVLVSAVSHSSSRAAHLSTAHARDALLSGREEAHRCGRSPRSGPRAAPAGAIARFCLVAANLAFLRDTAKGGRAVSRVLIASSYYVRRRGAAKRVGSARTPGNSSAADRLAAAPAIAARPWHHPISSERARASSSSRALSPSPADRHLAPHAHARHGDRRRFARRRPRSPVGPGGSWVVDITIASARPLFFSFFSSCLCCRILGESARVRRPGDAAGGAGLLRRDAPRARGGANPRRPRGCLCCAGQREAEGQVRV